MMTPEQFEQAVATTRLKPHTVAAARLVLVDGKGKAEAGNAVDPRMHREQVRAAVARIERAHKDLIGAPCDWACLTVALPLYGEAWQAVEKIQRKALDAAKK